MAAPQTPMDSDTPANQPSVARMYDYYLGGHHNFPVDREAAERIKAIQPDFPLIMQTNRAFLRRAVTFLVAQGIRQFLDIGSGIPTAGNVHEVAQQLAPGARVVYVDSDPIAVTHSAALLADNPTASVVEADAREIEQILSAPEVKRLLDFDQPMAVLLLAFLHFITDDRDALRIVARLRDAVAPGSYVAISHAMPTFTPEVQNEALAIYNRTSAPVTLRSSDQIARFFEGLEPAPPGLVLVPLWRPEGPDDLFLDEPRRAGMLAGVARKP